MEDFSWVKDWRKYYISKAGDNARKGGATSECTKRMEDVFKLEPSLNEELVYKVTDFYISNVSNKEYIMRPHYFLWRYPFNRNKGDEKFYTILDQYELYMENKEEYENRPTLFRNKMN